MLALGRLSARHPDLEAYRRSGLLGATVKATVTAWVSVSERTRPTLLGWIDAAAGVCRAYFEGGYELGSRRTKSWTICRAKVLIFPARGIAALPKKLASMILMQSVPNAAGFECVRA